MLSCWKCLWEQSSFLILSLNHINPTICIYIFCVSQNASKMKKKKTIHKFIKIFQNEFYNSAFATSIIILLFFIFIIYMNFLTAHLSLPCTHADECVLISLQKKFFFFFSLKWYSHNNNNNNINNNKYTRNCMYLILNN